MSADIVERLPELPAPALPTSPVFYPASACTTADAGPMYPPMYSADQMRAYAAEAVRTALAERAAVPEGWKLVPVEPTLEMKEAALIERANDRPTGNIWRAMLAAAPQPPAERAAVPAQVVEQAHAYAHRLAVNIHAKHYAYVTQWKPLPDLLGLLTQIDNMTAGLAALTAQPAAAPESAQAVAFTSQLAIDLLKQGTSAVVFPMPGEYGEIALYTHPAPARVAVALTEEQRIAVRDSLNRFPGYSERQLMMATERAVWAAHGLTAPEDGVERHNV